MAWALLSVGGSDGAYFCSKSSPVNASEKIINFCMSVEFGPMPKYGMRLSSTSSKSRSFFISRAVSKSLVARYFMPFADISRVYFLMESHAERPSFLLSLLLF